MNRVADDDPQFADLLDDLLDQLLNGEQPDLAATAARYPRVAHRIDEAHALASNLAGRKIDSKPKLRGYEILRELGRGGMGTVYLARQDELDRRVALKVLPHSIGLSVHSRQRFIEEARALARIKHRNIVDIHRIVAEGELLAFEMEFVEGPSLQEVLAALRHHRRTNGTADELEVVAGVIGTPPEQLPTRSLIQFFVHLARSIADALAAVHRAGFVHRDVKPANILLRADGEPVLVDFGLVRMRGLAATQTGRFAGTPVYSSPEQLRGASVIGPAADVYSLGVTLYECLTLATPFAGRTTTDLLLRIESGRFRPLRKLRPDAPLDLQTILHHAMEANTSRRYPDGAALADDLRRLLELRPIRARPASLLRHLTTFARRNQQPILAAVLGAFVVALVTLPIMHGIEARARSEDRATEMLATARAQVVRVDAEIALRTGSRPSLSAQQLQEDPLQAALAAYDNAAALAELPAAAAREHQVVRLADWLRNLDAPDYERVATALSSREFGILTQGLGPVTTAVARVYAGAPGATLPTTADGTADDRFCAGLLAYLCGDLRTCEQAWSGVGMVGDNPLVDAGLGRIMLADGMYEDAFTRLRQAQRQLPGSATLAAALCETALLRGNLETARKWLAHMPPGADAASLRARLELDLRAAETPGEDLRADYQRLAQAAPDDPTPRHRLAQMAMRRGDLDTAAHTLDALLAHWPEAAAFRLDRARTALLQGDLAAYGRQVLAALERDFGRSRSRGTIARYLELLRIGGVESLYLEGIARTGGETGGLAAFGDEIPIQSFAPASLTAHFADAARLIHWVRQRSAQLRGPDRRLDGFSSAILLAVPLIAQRLPMCSFSDRLAAHLLPHLAGPLYERTQPYVRRLLIECNFRGWQHVPLTPVARPVDLPGNTTFGHTLRTVHDATGDGLRDVLIAATASHPRNGESRVLLVDGRTATVVATIAGRLPKHLFGFSLDEVGDLDGDGARDWLVGAPSGSTDDMRGSAELWSSRTRQRLHLLRGQGAGFGASVCGLSDRDGDGVEDFAVATAPIVRNQTPQGRVDIYSGRTLEVLATWRHEVPGVWFGAWMANVGDTNGDGFADVVVGGNYGDAPGLARLYDGRTDAVLHTWTDPSDTSGFAARVAGVGDLDGDGAADVAVSALGPHRAEASEVRIYSGRTGKLLSLSCGAGPGDNHGMAVLGYVHATGRHMLAVGAPLNGEPITGAFQLIDAYNVTYTRVFGPRIRGYFGWAMAAVDDDDGDGWPELFVSDPASHDDGAVWRVASRSIPQLQGR
ncbi:MAG TPA: hypothetical protein ENI87_04180 [bacterium]|nr:hypothetical protein [bacterium]